MSMELERHSKKGSSDWLKSANPDVICLQEIKAQEEQLELECI